MNRKDLALIGMGAALASPRTQRVQHKHTEVHEHRAPTDESVKLLKEMEEKAAQKIIKTVSVVDNEWHGEILFMRHEYDNRVEAVAVFTLNGRRFKVNAECYPEDAREKLVLLLHKAVAEAIATEVLSTALEGVRSPW